MKKILTLLMVFVAVLLKAQSGEISGKLVDENGEGLYPATVIIVDATGKNTSTGTTTDFDGNYSIKPLKPGSYDVKYSYIGYAAQIQKGVLVRSDQTTQLEIKLNPASNLTIEVEVVAYKVPLIERGQTTIVNTLDKGDIKNRGTQSITELVATTAGVSEGANRGEISIRGGRPDATVYIINGRKVLGKPNVPVQSVEQLSVITGGVPARYGDATGGIVNITTKGPSAEYTGGLSFQTSQGLDAFGYNQANANLMGPIASKGKGKDKRVILGFSTSFEFLSQKDRSPSAIGVWQVKKDVLNNIKANPYIQNPNTGNINYSSEFLTFKDLYLTKAKPNNEQKDYKGVLQFDLSPVKNINFTFGGDVSYTKFHNLDDVYSYSLLNSENAPSVKELDYSVFGRFTHNVDLSKTKDGKERKTAVQNFVYSLQFDYEKYLSGYEDQDHKNNFFRYGYLGKIRSISDYEYTYKDITIDNKTYSGYVQTSIEPKNKGIGFTPGTENPLGTRFIEQFFQLKGEQKNANGEYIYKEDGYSASTLANEAKLDNTFRSNSVYGIWHNIGRQYYGYGTGTSASSRNDGNRDQYRARIEASFDILKPGSATTNKHSIEFGYEFDQRIQRSYSIFVGDLWSIANSSVNTHFVQDSLGYIFRINGKDYALNDPNRPAFGNTDTVIFGVRADKNSQTAFDRNLRKRLGYDDLKRIDIYNLSYDQLSLDLFSPSEIIEKLQGNITNRGYDYTGKLLTTTPTLQDFFSKKNADGDLLRQQGAFKPIYMAGYISDKFVYKDLGFLVGLRIDRYDANQYVLRDQYSLYDTKTKGEVGSLDGKLINHPANIGDDYAVYLSKYGKGAEIVGYRKGDEWFNKYGLPTTITAIKTSSGGNVNPLIDEKYEDRSKILGLVATDSFDANASFMKYKAKYTFMPRLQFSFNITDKAQFFAHYDILSQRPQSRNQLNLTEYLRWPTNSGLTIVNPNLKPETTIDYEFGFKQVVTKTSAVTISAYYKEYRNLIQIRKVTGAFPSDYFTYDNIDFVSTKGLNVIYDMRRVANFKFNINYTLQFAEGTGSDDRSQLNLADAGVPNYRTIYPVSFDSRHQINANIDFRFDEGKNYNGPIVGNKQILANFGINLLLQARSGTPYSSSANARDEASISPSGRASYLSLNGPRLPWSFKADLRINKDFAVNTSRKGEDKNSKKLYFTVYLLIQNLFNNANVLSVYSYTGNANDDGWLDAPSAQNTINSAVGTGSVQSYRDLYRASVNDPSKYSIPRRIFLGASFNF